MLESLARRIRLNSVTTAVLQFALSGLLAVAALGFVAVRLLQDTGRREAIRDAKEVTRLAGEGIVAPGIGAGLLQGRHDAIARLDTIVRRQVLRDPVVRVKIWSAAGRILYSDEHALIGGRYALAEDELTALRTGGVDAEVSDLSKPENRFERSQHKLLEVYQGLRAPGGQRLLFETYQRYSSVAASGRRLWLSFAPALIIALVLLELVQIPLALALARRVRRGQQEQERLLRRAVEASDVERRRIARDLHDGAVQDLAGVSFGLSAVAQRLPDRSSPIARSIDEAARQTRRSIRDLRTLLVDLYPPELHRAGLAAAINDLVASLRERGVEPEVAVDADLRLPEPVEALLFRAAQETLRNVLAHAAATHVEVTVTAADGTAELIVADDGRGFQAPRRRADDTEREHFGLRMLDDLARDAGGKFSISARDGGGTQVRMAVPLA
jgi:signal transduction histidine kinase